jgi:hypothetical protein
VDHHNLHHATEILVSHRNAPLSPTGRLRLARCVVDERWPLRRAAERFQVSVSTPKHWAAPPARTERRIINIRVLRRWGPARIAFHLRLMPSTVHRVLVRYGLTRLTHLDRATALPVRRYVCGTCPSGCLGSP